VTRIFCLIATLAFLSAGAASAPSASPGQPGALSSEDSSVLAVMDRYLTAISAQDIQAMAAMQTPDGMTYRARRADADHWEVVARPNSYWVDPAHVDGRSHRERYWSPTVMVRGAIAVVWAPYEFWIDGKTSHCGVDLFNLVKVDGVWLVSNAMWTVEPDACTELRPADASSIRPTE
jgi:hypothetical protein